MAGDANLNRRDKGRRDKGRRDKGEGEGAGVLGDALAVEMVSLRDIDLLELRASRGARASSLKLKA